MEYVLIFIIGTVISWIGLLIIIPIAQKLAEFAFPPWSETLWKLAVVAAAGNGIAVALAPVNVWLSWVVGFVVFWIFMYKWFEVDLFGAIIIGFVASIVHSLLGAVLRDLILIMSSTM